MAYIIHLATLISVWSILAVSLNLVVGVTGLLSVTHAAFFGLGAYATAILLAKLGVNFFISLVVGMIFAAAAAFLIGLVLSRFKHDHYALASLGFNVIVFSIFLNWQEVTRGPLGIPGISRPEIFTWKLSSGLSFLILAAIIALAAYLIAEWLERSSFGRALKAIREDEEAAKVFGYQTLWFKLMVFVIAAAMAAAAGSLFASYITFIDPSTFSLNESIFILSIVILGGLSSNRGAVLGAVLLVLLPEALRFVGFPSGMAAQLRQVAYGLLLVILMLYRPQGILGKFRL